MIKSYFILALRNFMKYKGYSATNVFGLSIGITSFILIFVYIQHETSYDKFFNESAQIYRINNTYIFEGEQYPYPTCASAIGPAIQSNFSGVEAFTRFFRVGGNQSTLIRIADDEFYNEKKVLAADSTFFSLFDFKLLEGSYTKSLASPNSVILTQSVAQKYFHGADALGKQVVMPGQGQAPDITLKVTGIMADLPVNTHLDVDLLVSAITFQNQGQQNNANAAPFLNSWVNDGFYTYCKLAKGQMASTTTTALNDLLKQNLPENQIPRSLSLTALHDIHLHSNFRNELKPNGNSIYINVFGVVGIFLIFIAVINYVNLATARSARRSREVGIRKIMGAIRVNLIFQFLGESVLITFVSTVISILLAYITMPFFGAIVGQVLTLNLAGNYLLIGSLVAIIIIVGVGSGIYPALFLSSFQPASVLKGVLSGKGGASWLRKTLVVFQFSISIFMMLGTIVIYKQLNYIRTKDLGFDKEHVMVVANTNNAMTPKLQTFKNELMQSAQVQHVSASLSKPGGLRPIIQLRTEQMTSPDEYKSVAGINIDLHYLSAMGIEVVQGRDFDPSISTDSTEAIILNKKCVALLGLGPDAVNKTIEMQLGQNQFVKKRIIGVVDDINFEPLNRKTEEAFYGLIFPQPNFNFLMVKLSGDDTEKGINQVRETWQKLLPERVFEYTFLDDDLYLLYKKEERLSKVILYFATLSIIVACFGLFGLASFITEQRIKEIGVRKVLGASIQQIIVLLSKEFVVLIIVSFILAAPLGYYFISSWWLENNFVYHTTVGWFSFLLTLGLSLFIAVGTISYRAIKAALANPIEAIRYE